MTQKKMVTSNDYRLYLESKFTAIHEKLDLIVEQTTRTNNRVNHLEEQRDKYLETRVSTDMLSEYDKRIDDIRGCLKVLDKDLEEYRMVKKYPKIWMIAIAVFVIGIIVSAIGTVETLSNKKQTEIVNSKLDYLNTPPTYRGGTYDPFAKDTTK